MASLKHEQFYYHCSLQALPVTDGLARHKYGVALEGLRPCQVCYMRPAPEFSFSPFSVDIQNYQQTNRAVQNRNEYHTN